MAAVTDTGGRTRQVGGPTDRHRAWAQAEHDRGASTEDGG